MQCVVNRLRHEKTTRVIKTIAKISRLTSFISGNRLSRFVCGLRRTVARAARAHRPRFVQNTTALANLDGGTMPKIRFAVTLLTMGSAALLGSVQIAAAQTDPGVRGGAAGAGGPLPGISANNSTF